MVLVSAVNGLGLALVLGKLLKNYTNSAKHNSNPTEKRLLFEEDVCDHYVIK